jgi:hypothetical protein
MNAQILTRYSRNFIFSFSFSLGATATTNRIQQQRQTRVRRWMCEDNRRRRRRRATSVTRRASMRAGKKYLAYERGKVFFSAGGEGVERRTYWVHTAYLRLYESGEYFGTYFGTYFCILNYTIHYHHMRIKYKYYYSTNFASLFSFSFSFLIKKKKKELPRLSLCLYHHFGTLHEISLPI